MNRLALLACVAVLCHACATAPETASATKSALAPATATTPAVLPSALEKSIDYNGILVAGQPNSLDLQSLAGRNIRSVFNLRTPEEMSALGFDQAQMLKDAGIGYEQHPISGNAAWTPQVLEAFAKAVEANDGRVFLHCASGARAATLYAAYAMSISSYRLNKPWKP